MSANALGRLGLACVLVAASGIAGLAQTPSPSPSAIPSATPAPAPSATGARIHLHQPGTEIDADTLVGNLASKQYTVAGHVVVHDDPKVDKKLDTSTTQSDEPIELHADRLAVDEIAKRYAAHGSITFTQGDRSGSADDATLDDRTHDLDLTGNARVAEAGRILAADTIHYNTGTKAFAGNGNVEIIAPVPTAAPGTPAPKKKRRIPLPV